MYGVFLSLLVRNIFPESTKKAVLLNTLIFVGINLVMGLSGGIDNAAHVGGLISGLILGQLIYPNIKREREELH